MPLGLPFFFKHNKYPDQFQWASVTTQTQQLFWKFPLIMFFPKMKNDIITSCASTISIDSTTKNSPYTIDGEIFNSNGKNITIGLGPRLQFVKI